MVAHHFPFGKYVGQPLQVATSGYLLWFLTTPKTSTGLRRAIRQELITRGQDPAQLPSEPPMKPVVCRRCGNQQPDVSWHEQAGGQRVIRADCDRCGRFVGFLPLTEENAALADANRSPTGLLDVLTRADDEGVELVCRDGQVTAEGKASAGLQALIRQHQHALVRYLGGH